MNRQVVPSILSADFTQLGPEVDRVVSQGATRLHLDVMDGHFVPNLTFGPMVIRAVRKLTDAHLETHLMIEHPGKYVADYVEAGSDTVLIQEETCPHLHRDLQAIRDAGAIPGVVLNPGTSLEAITEVLNDIGHLLIMTVNPGFGGQKFIKSMVNKIRRARKLIRDREIRLEVDGGIDLSTIGDARDAGADLFVVGSSIYGEENPGQAYKDLNAKLVTVV